MVDQEKILIRKKSIAKIRGIKFWLSIFYCGDGRALVATRTDRAVNEIAKSSTVRAGTEFS